MFSLQQPHHYSLSNLFSTSPSSSSSSSSVFYCSSPHSFYPSLNTTNTTNTTNTITTLSSSSDRSFNSFSPVKYQSSKKIKLWFNGSKYKKREQKKIEKKTAKNHRQPKNVSISTLKHKQPISPTPKVGTRKKTRDRKKSNVNDQTTQNNTHDPLSNGQSVVDLILSPVDESNQSENSNETCSNNNSSSNNNPQPTQRPAEWTFDPPNRSQSSLNSSCFSNYKSKLKQTSKSKSNHNDIDSRTFPFNDSCLTADLFPCSLDQLYTSISEMQNLLFSEILPFWLQQIEVLPNVLRPPPLSIEETEILQGISLRALQLLGNVLNCLEKSQDDDNFCSIGVLPERLYLPGTKLRDSRQHNLSFSLNDLQNNINEINISNLSTTKMSNSSSTTETYFTLNTNSDRHPYPYLPIGISGFLESIESPQDPLASLSWKMIETQRHAHFSLQAVVDAIKQRHLYEIPRNVKDVESVCFTHKIIRKLFMDTTQTFVHFNRLLRYWISTTSGPPNGTISTSPTEFLGLF